MSVHQLSIDPAHSTVGFAVTFATNAVVTGRFLDFGGQITLDTEQPERSSVTAWIDPASLTTDHEPRDEQLRGPDFFDVEEHAELRFESTGVTALADDHWRVTGNLTMRGQTCGVTLDTRYYGIVEDAWGTLRAGFVAEADIQRTDWGMTWNEPQESGSLLGDRVRITLYISATVSDEMKDEPEEGESEEAGEREEPGNSGESDDNSDE